MSYCEHKKDKWEFNPKSKVYTRRCVRCGRILETIKSEE